MQGEHFNQTNFTYEAGGTWRGSGHTPSISWILAATLYYGTKMAELGVFAW
jgi:DNA-binding protein H-NS